MHRHSVDLRCGRHFVKVGHAPYAKLALLHRRAMPAEGAPEAEAEAAVEAPAWWSSGVDSVSSHLQL